MSVRFRERDGKIIGLFPLLLKHIMTSQKVTRVTSLQLEKKKCLAKRNGKDIMELSFFFNFSRINYLNLSF